MNNKTPIDGELLRAAYPGIKGSSISLDDRFARNPKFPNYSLVKDFLIVLDGQRKSSVRGLITAKSLEAGSQGAPVSWRNPDEWMDERLVGDELDIAKHIWKGSMKTVNPANIYGSYLLISRYNLLGLRNGIFERTVRTELFLEDFSNVVCQVDFQEGIFQILLWASNEEGLTNDTLHSNWHKFCEEFTNMRSGKSIRSSLYQRVRNCRERSLLNSGRYTTSSTKLGREYINNWNAILEKQYT